MKVGIPGPGSVYIRANKGFKTVVARFPWRECESDRAEVFRGPVSTGKKPDRAWRKYLRSSGCRSVRGAVMINCGERKLRQRPGFNRHVVVAKGKLEIRQQTKCSSDIRLVAVT